MAAKVAKQRIKKALISKLSPTTKHQIMSGDLVPVFASSVKTGRSGLDRFG